MKGINHLRFHVDESLTMLRVLPPTERDDDKLGRRLHWAVVSFFSLVAERNPELIDEWLRRLPDEVRPCGLAAEPGKWRSG